MWTFSKPVRNRQGTISSSAGAVCGLPSTFRAKKSRPSPKGMAKRQNSPRNKMSAVRISRTIDRPSPSA